MLRPDDRERARPRAAASARGRALRPERRASQPDPPGVVAADLRRRAGSRRADVPRAAPGRVRDGPRRARRAVPRLARLDRGDCGSTGATGSSARASASGWPRRSASTSRAVFRATAWDAQFPADRMLAGARGDARSISASTSATRRTSSSTSSSDPEGRRARSASPIEVPERVMLVIQPIGGPRRLARALPRGRPRGALRAHVAPTCRSRSGGWATTRSRRAGRRCWSTSSTSRRGSTAASTCPARRSSRRKARSGSCTYVRRYCAKLLYELELHAADEPVGARGRATSRSSPTR